MNVPKINDRKSTSNNSSLTSESIKKICSTSISSTNNCINKTRGNSKLKMSNDNTTTMSKPSTETKNKVINDIKSKSRLFKIKKAIDIVKKILLLAKKKKKKIKKIRMKQREKMTSAKICH